MTVENISWSISTKECCRPRRGWTRDLLVSSRTAHPTEPPRAYLKRMTVENRRQKCDLPLTAASATGPYPSQPPQNVSGELPVITLKAPSKIYSRRHSIYYYYYYYYSEKINLDISCESFVQQDIFNLKKYKQFSRKTMFDISVKLSFPLQGRTQHMTNLWHFSFLSQKTRSDISCKLSPN